MGNVIAQEAGSFSSPFTPAPFASEKTEEVVEEKPIDLSSLELPKEDNPGTVEELHRCVREITPQAFEGGKFVINRGMSQHLMVSHNISLSSIQTPSYRFGGTYLGEINSPSDIYPVLLGDIDPRGNLNANFIHQFIPGVKTKMVCQIEDSKCNAMQITNDYAGKHFTLSSTLSNIDIFTKSGLGVFHYLHQVSDRWAVGGELAVQKGPQVPGGTIMMPSLCLKYRGASGNMDSMSIGAAGVHLAHFQKCSDTFAMGAELEASLRTGETVGSTCLQMDIPKGDAVLKSKIDSNGTVTSTFEKRLLPLPFTFSVCGMYNHPKDKFRVGVGFTIG